MTSRSISRHLKCKDFKDINQSPQLSGLDVGFVHALWTVLFMFINRPHFFFLFLGGGMNEVPLWIRLCIKLSHFQNTTIEVSTGYWKARSAGFGKGGGADISLPLYPKLKSRGFGPLFFGRGPNSQKK